MANALELIETVSRRAEYIQTVAVRAADIPRALASQAPLFRLPALDVFQSMTRMSEFHSPLDDLSESLSRTVGEITSVHSLNSIFGGRANILDECTRASEALRFSEELSGLAKHCNEMTNAFTSSLNFRAAAGPSIRDIIGFRPAFEYISSKLSAPDFSFATLQLSGLTESYSRLLREPVEFSESWRTVSIDFPHYEVRAATDLAGSLFEGAESTSFEIPPEWEADESIEGLLAEIDPRLSRLWHGAKEAVDSRNPDSQRHAAVSVRELLDQLIRRLAPDKDVVAWNPLADKLSRTIRLSYITRRIESKATAEFIHCDIRSVTAYMELLNCGTHSVDPPFTRVQLSAMLKRAEGLIAYLMFVERLDD